MTMERSAVAFTGKNIVIISPEDWDDNMLSKHHIALALANRNNTVWFICASRDGNGTTVRSPDTNIFVINHQPFRGVNRMPAKLARLVSWCDVKKLQRIIKQPIHLVWSFDPYHLQFLRLFRGDHTIYHPVDSHYTALEERVLKEADIVFTNTDFTLSRLKHPNKHKIGHGVASYFFLPGQPIPLPGDFDLKVGYAGNLNNRLLDFPLFLKLAKRYPKIGFYLVGPRGASNLSTISNAFFNWEEMDKLPNVFWLGQQRSAWIPSFLQRMDILLVLYKPDDTGFTVNPHKLLEYLSSGNVVLAPWHEENRSLDDLIVQAKDLSHMSDAFQHVLENLKKYQSAEIREARIAFAQRMNYENRIREIEHICHKTLLKHG